MLVIRGLWVPYFDCSYSLYTVYIARNNLTLNLGLNTLSGYLYITYYLQGWEWVWHILQCGWCMNVSKCVKWPSDMWTTLGLSKEQDY